MALTRHLKARLQSRAKQRGADPDAALDKLRSLGQLSGDVAVVVAETTTIDGLSPLYLVVICRDGRAVTAYWHSQLTTSSLRVDSIVGL